MSISRQVDSGNALVIINIEGRFDFSEHRPFRDAYRDIAPGSVRFLVDLSRADYLDSSALGMLLLLREHAGTDAGRVTIRGCTEDVLRILRIANFDRLFILE
ncbi:STAS domain-containing protein [Ectothiorhodospira lacustris]|uniref:STAS domain-containing protein n=1 Tax=Ectothiorhodospira lacustris TaxID=2899127 RepID=UPI001EE886EE|nr:STAS domain-containing protein [Ectothiorhodospira lacustris]MCG5500324.1 STAS domain-containing protein [Ectothiorhodospira lacustris]MCG5510120.1 STAS domain-containing protein [Ectothiorhodospira lacustris]MCG5521963.1 STAS domain-containing protein [Ectothiorhodospira lacustris]